MTQQSVSDIHHWQDVASRAFVPLRCSSATPGFTATLQPVARASQAAVTRVRSGPVRVERDGTMARRGDHDELLFSLQLGSRGSVHQHGRTAVVDPGQAVLYETNHPYVLDHPDPGQDLVVLRVDRDRVGLDRRTVSEACGRALDGSVPGMSALAGFIRGLVDDSVAGQGGRSEDMAFLGGDLVGMVLRSLVREQPSGWTSARVLFDEASRYLRAHLQVPGLTVDEVAAAHFVSTRTLHQAFADHGATPGAYLRDLRLEHAASLLSARTVRTARTARTAGQTVAGIARACGFRDATTFSRAFARRFGCTPGEWDGGR